MATFNPAAPHEHERQNLRDIIAETYYALIGDISTRRVYAEDDWCEAMNEKDAYSKQRMATLVLLHAIEEYNAASVINHNVMFSIECQRSERARRLAASPTPAEEKGGASTSAPAQT